MPCREDFLQLLVQTSDGSFTCFAKAIRAVRCVHKAKRPRYITAVKARFIWAVGLRCIAIVMEPFQCLVVVVALEMR